MHTDGYPAPSALHKSFLLAVVIHLALAILLWCMRPEQPLQILFQITLQPDARRIPEKVRETIRKEIREIEEKSKSSVKKSSSSQSEKTVSESENREAEISRYEKTLFARKNSDIPAPLRADEEVKDGAIRGTKSATQETVPSTGGNRSSGSAGGASWISGGRRNTVFFPPVPYPAYYREKGIQGDVTVRFEVAANGSVISVEILKSSGHSQLDLLARNAVRNSRYSPAPEGSPISVAERVIRFRLVD